MRVAQSHEATIPVSHHQGVVMSTLTWTEANCPPAITSLPKGLRAVALAYVNAEIEAGRHPDRALSYGIAKAFANDGDDLGPDATGLFIQAEGDRWVIFSDASEDRYTFDDYEDALRRGGELARARKLPLLVMSSDGGILEKYEFSEDGGAGLQVRPTASGWLVLGPEGRAEYATKKDALADARVWAREFGVDLVVHYRDGTVQARTSYASA
jgi:hypothetical protein